jgi:hypothetical protein
MPYDYRDSRIEERDDCMAGYYRFKRTMTRSWRATFKNWRSGFLKADGHVEATKVPAGNYATLRYAGKTHAKSCFAYNQ